MFGMLDYRAYKLFWLVGLPFRLAGRVIYFIFIAVAVLIGTWTGYQPLVQMVVGYISFEAIFMVFGFLWLLLITWPVEKIFFWIVDVVPSKGEDVEEAKEIVRKGPYVWLSKKMVNHIDEWTFEDTQAWISVMNWRARLFFNEKEKFFKRLAVLQRAYDDTGKQPSEIGEESKYGELLKPYKPSWFQIAVMTP